MTPNMTGNFGKKHSSPLSLTTYPPKLRIRGRNHTPWMNSEILHLIKKKNSVPQRLIKCKSQSEGMKKKFKDLRKTIKKMLNESRANYFNSLCNNPGWTQSAFGHFSNRNPNHAVFQNKYQRKHRRMSGNTLTMPMSLQLFSKTISDIRLYIWRGHGIPYIVVSCTSAIFFVTIRSILESTAKLSSVDSKLKWNFVIVAFSNIYFRTVWNNVITIKKHKLYNW